MSKIALLIIYNHRYDKNIPALEKLYQGRFDHLFHVIPFYDGEKANVIPVYESSFYFSGYISQAYSHLKNQGFTHFFVVADDMILNPEIDQSNLFEKMGLREDECFLDYLHILQELDWHWHQHRAMAYSIKQRGVEIQKILPDKEFAKQQLAKYGVPDTAISIKPYLRKWDFLLKYLKNYKRRVPEYPMVGGYADIMLVTAEAMDKFALYCGAFAATSLFVEIAVPTALALATDKLKLSKELTYQSGALWSKEDKAFLEKYHFSLAALLADFPKEKLFLHPIKLSQWR